MNQNQVEEVLRQAESAIAAGDFRQARRLYAQLSEHAELANQERFLKIKKTLTIDPAQIFVVVASLAVFLWAVWRYWLQS